MRDIKENHASVGLVVAAISIIIIVAAGFLIYYNIGSQLSGLPATGKTTASTMNNTTNFILGTLAPIGAIVLIASAVIIAVVALDKR